MKKQDAKSETAKRIARTEAYAEKVRQQFAQTVNAILALNKSMPTLDEGVMFSFDDQSMKMQKQVEQLLRQLHSVATMAIKKGITLEWEQANIECDKLVQSCFGKKVLSSPEFAAWTQRNEKARDAFIARSDNGLNLSDRVWQSVRQLRDEMEVAMTVAIGEGDSAASMSRKVREYLNEPDLMFRRFRYKDEETGEWKRKWKKRIKDETTGKYRWIDYNRDDYKTGAGVYKSSAKNAMRVARTETNIAYRRADNERWKQMDFVLGQKIQLSHSHPKKDICDKLQGDYPAEFVFDGWHPQCFCFATPILMDEEEMAKVTEAFLRGEKYTPKGKKITSYPQNFKDWVTEHSEQIAASRDRGTEPYFIKNNAAVIDNILNPKDEPLSIAEIAAKRHAERTPEKEKQLREYWDKKKAEGEKKRSEEKAVKRYGDRILAYMDGISDVDISALTDAIQADDISKILLEANKLKTIGKKILSLSHLDNPMKVARDFSMADAITVNNAVESRMARESSDIYKLKSFLESEIKWVESHKKYSTWKVAQDAYKKELRIIENRIEIKTISDSVADALAYSSITRSKTYKAIADEMRTILSSSRIDIATAKAKAKELNDKLNQLKSRGQKQAKSVSSSSIKHEMISDLKSRLGSKMPRTLDNLEKAISSYERTSKYGSKAKSYKSEIEKLMARLFDEHDLGMNIDDDILEVVLTSWFKNTFETGSSGGYLGSSSTTGKISSSHSRLEAAHKLFGLSSDLDKGQLSRKEYEKYGNLLDHDIVSSMAHNTARQYGNVEVRFKKDKVIATWTAGDSLGEQYQPSLVSDPRSCSFDNMSRTPTSSSIQTKDLAKFKRDHISSYLELQYHGDLTIDCVESLTFPYDLKESSRSKYLAIAKKWKAAGAKIYYVAGGVLYQL